MNVFFEATQAPSITSMLSSVLGFLIDWLLGETLSFVVSRWMLNRNRKRISQLTVEAKGDHKQRRKPKTP